MYLCTLRTNVAAYIYIYRYRVHILEKKKRKRKKLQTYPPEKLIIFRLDA